jgi:hypothetical protein
MAASARVLGDGDEPREQKAPRFGHRTGAQNALMAVTRVARGPATALPFRRVGKGPNRYHGS